MKRAQSRGGTSSKRRTTLTLPSDSLKHAQRIARARNVTLSTVISEALSDGLRKYTEAERSEETLRAYQKAFAGFSQTDLLVLDGVVLESRSKSKV
jgi:hypothetical protein